MCTCANTAGGRLWYLRQKQFKFCKHTLRSVLFYFVIMNLKYYRHTVYLYMDYRLNEYISKIISNTIYYIIV